MVEVGGPDMGKEGKRRKRSCVKMQACLFVYTFVVYVGCYDAEQVRLLPVR